MKSIYISGPYTAASREEEDINIAAAAIRASDYLRKGYAVFCPHTHSAIIDREHNVGNLLGWCDWLTLDLFWLAKCDAIHMLPGWENSKGAGIEHMMAKALGLEIIYEEDH